MKSVFKAFFILTLLTAAQPVWSQNNAKQTPLIQFSGVVLDQDSLTEIPFVSVLIKGTRRGAVSDYYGFFSVVASPGDEIEFISIDHKPGTYKIPDTLRQKYYYAIQVLSKDTIHLPELEIFPWPSKEDFKRAFLALDLSDTDAERADKNLTRDELSYLERNQPASPTENYKYVMQTVYTKIYTSGQQPQINLLNPVKWAEFIDAWRKGKFSSDTKKKK